MDVGPIESHWLRAGDDLRVEDRDRWLAVGARALEHHREPHRAYHGVAHVVAVLDALVELAEVPSGELVAAAVFHDVVYDPKAATNEADSAVLAVDELSAVGADAAAVGRVVELIEATATHDVSGVRRVDVVTAGVFLDADLSILGAPADVYDAYAAAIRSEYAHVPEADFRTGRAAILEGFLARDRRFFSDRAHTRWDDQARQNLSRELAHLQKGSDP